MGSGNRHVGLDGVRAILGSPLYMWADSHAIRGGYPPADFLFSRRRLPLSRDGVAHFYGISCL